MSTGKFNVLGQPRVEPASNQGGGKGTPGRLMLRKSG